MPSLYCCVAATPATAPSPLASGFFRESPGTTETRFETHMPKDVILTPEGLQKLKEELEVLSTDKRREVAERIKLVLKYTATTENSEYDDAKNEQAMLESRIAALQEKLR